MSEIGRAPSEFYGFSRLQHTKLALSLIYIRVDVSYVKSNGEIAPIAMIPIIQDVRKWNNF